MINVFPGGYGDKSVMFGIRDVVMVNVESYRSGVQMKGSWNGDGGGGGGGGGGVVVVCCTEPLIQIFIFLCWATWELGK